MNLYKLRNISNILLWAEQRKISIENLPVQWRISLFEWHIERKNTYLVVEVNDFAA